MYRDGVRARDRAEFLDRAGIWFGSGLGLGLGLGLEIEFRVRVRVRF